MYAVDLGDKDGGGFIPDDLLEPEKFHKLKESLKSTWNISATTHQYVKEYIQDMIVHPQILSAANKKVNCIFIISKK